MNEVRYVAEGCVHILIPEKISYYRYMTSINLFKIKKCPRVIFQDVLDLTVVYQFQSLKSSASDRSVLICWYIPFCKLNIKEAEESS